MRAILLVSDHGAKRIDGGICINEWLIREGYLVPQKYPQTPAGNLRHSKSTGQKPQLGARVGITRAFS